MKVFSLPPHENWICDRFLEEWNQHNPDIITQDLNEADINWILAGWQWNKIPVEFLREKTTVLTVHHIVPDKFDEQKKDAFMQRDQFIDWYHVPCYNTEDQIREYTDKPIFVQPFWANQFIWYNIEDKEDLRKSLGLPKDAYIIGSFQRDTEGHDLKSPKLEKGPDRFVEIVAKMRKTMTMKKFFVVLAGPRRQYVINRLASLNIPYEYFEFVEFETLNELYNCLDLYIVSSRYEGGPQSVIECALTKTPIISTRVGVASQFLPYNSLYNSVDDFQSAWMAESNVDFAYNSVMRHKIPNGFKPFRGFFESILAP